MTPEQEALVLDNLRLPSARVRRLGYSGWCYEDELEDEARLALVVAATSYNSAKSKFETFAWFKIDCAIKDLIRRQFRTLSRKKYRELKTTGNITMRDRSFNPMVGKGMIAERPYVLDCHAFRCGIMSYTGKAF